MAGPTHTQQNGQLQGNATPNVRDIGRGHSYVQQQRDIKAHRRHRGPMRWHLRSPKQTSDGRLAAKNHLVAMIGEFVGTCLFMIFALGGTNVALVPSNSVSGGETAGQDGSSVATPNTSNLLYIALSFGFSLAVNAWIFFRVSGGLFNPAVSWGMMLVGALTPLRAALLTISQILGGIVGAAIIQAITPGALNCRTTLGGGTSVTQGLFIEMWLTAMLMLAILLLAAEKTKATFLAPIGIGLALFIAELTGVYYTGGSLNPARSFGPDVVLRTFAPYHWIYWLGPVMGATLAAGFYKFIKYLEYETVLGPDTDDQKPILPTSTSPGAGGGGTGTAGTTVEDGNKQGGNYAVFGAGLGDLLTQGPRKDVFDLPEGSFGATAERLDRIESMLSQLLSSNGHHRNTSQQTYPANRESMATFVGEDREHGKAKDHMGVGMNDVDIGGRGTGTGTGFPLGVPAIGRGGGHEV